MKSRLRSHRHEHGHWCHCPFGNAEPYVSPKAREAYGSTAMWHEAAKYEWLMKRPDVKDSPEHVALVKMLQHSFPNNDELYPWLLREYKKGRITGGLRTTDHGSQSYKDLHDRGALDVLDLDNVDARHNLRPWWSYTNHQGRTSTLDPDHLDQIQDWMKYQKQAKKGVDIMTHHIGDAAEAAQKADIGGEVVHEFPNGYKVVRLRNKRDMRREGQRMNHCVGSNGMGYLEKNEDGEGLYYSLREPDNTPVGTAELGKSADTYWKCPSCGQYTSGYGRCNHCYEPKPEGVKEFPVDLKKVGNAPSSEVTGIEQMFGPGDNKMNEYHNDMFNEYFGHHGHSPYESDGESEEEEEFEPWWDNYYSVDGAENASDYLTYHRDGDYHEYGPDEYQRAVSDAYDHEVEPPELELGSPYWDSIFEDMQKNLDPDEINQVFQAAKDNGDYDELHERAQNWLNDEYYPYLDAYGQSPGGPYNKNLEHPPGVENSYYPQNDHDEMYFARNLEHQLDKHAPVDPQRGDRMDSQYEQNSRYPLIAPSTRDDAPTFPAQDVPIPEQTGPWVAQPARGYNNPRVELPYGRGDTAPVGRPDTRIQQADPANAPQRDMLGNPWRPPRPGTEPSDVPFKPRGLSTPEEFFGPGNETIDQHQRAFPGMTFERGNHMPLFDEDAGPIRYPQTQTPYDPNNPEMYPQGQQQGKLFPGGWYIDYAKKRAVETDLPEHLFPPASYGYHRPASFTDPYSNGNIPMWEDQNYDPGSRINTQNEIPHTNTDPALWGTQPRPTAEWTAKVAKHERVVMHPGGDYNKMPLFDWRVPVVYDKAEERMYVGHPAMEHADMMDHWGRENPWGHYSRNQRYRPGYIDTKGHVGEGGLHFYLGGSDINGKNELDDWVEKVYGVRAITDADQDTIPSDKWSKVAWQQEEGPADGREVVENQIDPERGVSRPVWRQDRRRRLDDAERADWEQNPNPLKWTPGKPGKGFLDKDGVLHTWNERNDSNYWMHSSQAGMRGVQSDPYTHIYMDQDGKVRDDYGVAYSYPGKAQEMMRQEPRIQFRGMEPVKDEFADADWD